MKNSPRIRYYYQVDTRSQPVAGTLVLRKKKPLVGRWRELTATPCCAAFELLYTPADVTDDTFTLTVLCGITVLATAIVSQPTPTVTINDVVALLNEKASYIGKFFVEGADIHLQLNTVLALNCADNSTLSFTVTP